MLIVALITVPDANEHRYGIPVDTAPDVVAEAVLGRVQDEAGYLDNGGWPITPAEITVHAITAEQVTAAESMRVLLDHLAAATAHGHGPL